LNHSKRDQQPQRLSNVDLLKWIVIQGLVAASAVPLGLFLFALLGRFYFFAELVGHFRFQITLMLVAALFILIVLKRKVLGGLIAVALTISVMGGLWVYLPLPANQPPPGSEIIKVMSFNVLAGNRQSKLVLEEIARSDPDFVSILEYSGTQHQRLDELKERYPYHARHPRWHGFGIAVFSKRPLSNTKVHQLTEGQTDCPMIITEVEVGGRSIRLAAVHVVSPTSRLRMDVRNQQLIEVADHLVQQDIPTVVMGDFNCTPWSPFLQDFTQVTGYRDSREGFGQQSTWRADVWWLQIPIDHAFVSDDIYVHSRVVGNPAGSDHMPIVLEISRTE
jgi:endonuclease/exonuclease/phosphatase (EEP) superfamily protein YafD